MAERTDASGMKVACEPERVFTEEFVRSLAENLTQVERENARLQVAIRAYLDHIREHPGLHCRGCGIYWAEPMDTTRHLTDCSHQGLVAALGRGVR